MGAEDVEGILSTLDSKKEEWAALPYREKAKLLGEMLEVFRGLDHETWARESIHTQGYEKVVPDVYVAIEMVMNTSNVVGDLETLCDVFCTLHETGKPPSIPMRKGTDGRMIADVFPFTRADMGGPQNDWRVETWLKGEHAGTQGVPPTKGRVGLVLGAGNQGMLAICDVLHLMFMENMVCVVKQNPVRAYNHKWMEKLFQPLMSRGYFFSTLVSTEEAQKMVSDARVHHIHMTGGKATHDVIVWGPGGQRENKVLQKPITSELGTVAPWVMGPGAWTDEEVRHHALYFTACLMQNNSCNCMSPQVLMLPQHGFPTEKFMSHVYETMKSRPHAPPYYPGTHARHKNWIESLSQQGLPTELIESNVKLPPGSHGPALPWVFSEIDFNTLVNGCDVVTKQEMFGPALCITKIPMIEGESGYNEFWKTATDFCNDKLFGSLAATLIQHPSNVNEDIVKNLRYGSVGVNSWGGQNFWFNRGRWGAYPGETLEAVESGIGHVRNYCLLRDTEKCVVRAPFRTPAHSGTQPLELGPTKYLCSLLSNSLSTARHDAGYITGNFLPIKDEGVHRDLKVTGQIPTDLSGAYLRNGVNQRYAPSGRMHMFDGDAMLHVFLFEQGNCKSYTNSYIRTPRFLQNESVGRDIHPTFGDIALRPGLETAKKIGYFELLQRAGTLPDPLPVTRAQNPSTATQLIAGALYCCIEVNSPFRVHIDPNNGKVHSDVHEDFGGKVPVFSAHSKVDLSGNVVYFAKGPRSRDAKQNAANHYGTIDQNGKVLHTVSFQCGEGPPPAFLHDCFVTARWSICVDHSLRADATKLAKSGYFQWDKSHNVRLGLFPRVVEDASSVAPEWYDLGFPGFIWHCVGAREEGDLVTCWMPIFEDDYSEVPIHLAKEGHSFLYKIVINTNTKSVIEVKKFEEIGPTERCAVNDLYVGERPPRYAYLMMRGSEEMYDGFTKFDLIEERVVAKVLYGHKRFGGEAFFQPREGSVDEDDGWLMDIIYDKTTDSSELCIWEGKVLEMDPAAKGSQPVAAIHAPRRIPYGVHGLFLTPDQLAKQWIRK